MLLSVFADLWLFVRVIAFPAILIAAGVVYLVRTTPAPVRREYRVVTLDEMFGPREVQVVTVLRPETVQTAPEVEPTVLARPHAQPVERTAAKREPSKPSALLVPKPVTGDSAVTPSGSRHPEAPVLGFREAVVAAQVVSGLSWVQFAAVCGVSSSTARSWANGSNPTAANRRRLDRVIAVVGSFDANDGERRDRWEARVDGVTLFDRTRTLNLDEGKVAA